MNQGKWNDLLAYYGSSLLNAIVADDSSDSDSDDDTVQSTRCQFIKKKSHEIKVPEINPKPNCLLKPDSLQPFPPELYRKTTTKEKRRQLFFKHLMRRDILYLQVINCNLEESYKCLVLAKHGDLMQLHDLSIVVHLPKLPPELKLLKEDLYKFDLIAGIFWSCCSWGRKLFVTLDTSVFTEQEKEKIPKLGKISRKDIPNHVARERVGMTYAGYVQRSAGYNEDNFCLKQLQECLAIDINRIYTFQSDWDGKQYPESECLEEIQKRPPPDASTEKLLKSYVYFRECNMYKALHYANKAIMHNPDNIDARVARGAVYANLGMMKDAFTDTEDSLKLDRQHEAAKKQMSELLVSASKQYLIQGKYQKWLDQLVLALSYNSNNQEAKELLTKSKIESVPSTSSNRASGRLLVPPSIADVTPIYKRIMTDKRLLKEYKRICKRKRKQHRRRRSERRRSRQRSTTSNQPIPSILSYRSLAAPSTSTARFQPIPSTSTSRFQPIPSTSTSRFQPIPSTSTGRRQVFRRPGSPVFRRPFPPSSTITRVHS